MITNNIGLNNQASGENIGKWGDTLNANNDRIAEILNCLIVQSAIDKKILHVFPTDSSGNPKIKDNIFQIKEIVSPSFIDIINGLIGDNDVKYPLTGTIPVIFGTLNSAMAQALVLATAGFKVEIILHPGVHVVTSSLIIPAGVTIKGMSKSTTMIKLQSVTMTFGASYSGLKSVNIFGNSALILFQPASISALSGLEVIDCSIDIPVYFDCKNIFSALDLFVKGNEFNSTLNFLNTAGNIVTLGAMVLMNNYINKNMIYIGGVVGTQGTQLSMEIYDGSLSINMKTEIDAFITAIKNIAAASLAYTDFQTAVAALDTASYFLSGSSGSISMGSPYPVLRNNYYA